MVGYIWKRLCYYIEDCYVVRDVTSLSQLAHVHRYSCEQKQEETARNWIELIYFVINFILKRNLGYELKTEAASKLVHYSSSYRQCLLNLQLWLNGYPTPGCQASFIFLIQVSYVNEYIVYF